MAKLKTCRSPYTGFGCGAWFTDTDDRNVLCRACLIAFRREVNADWPHWDFVRGVTVSADFKRQFGKHSTWTPA